MSKYVVQMSKESGEPYLIMDKAAREQLEVLDGKVDAADARIDKLVARTLLTGTNLNSLLEYGWYLIVSPVNAPAEYGSKTIYCEVTNYNNGTNYVIQRVLADESVPVFVRYRFNSQDWSPWLRESFFGEPAKSVLSAFDLNTKLDEGSFITTAFTNGPEDFKSTTAIIRNTKLATGWTLQELFIFGANGGPHWYRVNRGGSNNGEWINLTNYPCYSGVNFGDSIYGNNRSYNSITYKLRRLTGWEFFNAGAGGCRMSATAGNNYQRFSMVELADAVVSGNFTAQAAAAEALGSYYGDIVTGLSAIDFNTVDRITISYGTNDWSADVPIGSDDITDETVTTFKGALRYSIHKLSAKYPKAKIAVCGLFNRFDISSSPVKDGAEWENGNNNTVVDFCNAAKEVAEQFAVQYIDQFYIGVNKYNFTPYHYDNDGTHLNDLGCELAALNLYKKLY